MGRPVGTTDDKVRRKKCEGGHRHPNITSAAHARACRLVRPSTIDRGHRSIGQARRASNESQITQTTSHRSKEGNKRGHEVWSGHRPSTRGHRSTEQARRTPTNADHPNNESPFQREPRARACGWGRRRPSPSEANKRCRRDSVGNQSSFSRNQSSAQLPIATLLSPQCERARYGSLRITICAPVISSEVYKLGHPKRGGNSRSREQVGRR